MTSPYLLLHSAKIHPLLHLMMYDCIEGLQETDYNIDWGQVVVNEGVGGGGGSEIRLHYHEIKWAENDTVLLTLLSLTVQAVALWGNYTRVQNTTFYAYTTLIEMVA